MDLFGSSTVYMPNEAPIKEGYLTKRSEWIQDWRRRYFKLIRSQLSFMKTPAGPAHGVIDLRHCLTVKSAEEKTGKKFAFEVATSENTYFLFAESDEDKDDWIGKVGRAIVDNSRSHIRDLTRAEEDDDDDEDDEDE